MLIFPFASGWADWARLGWASGVLNFDIDTIVISLPVSSDKMSVDTLSKNCVFMTVSMSVLRPPTGWLAVSAPWPGLCLALLRATSEKRELLAQAGIDFGKNLTGY